MSFFELSIAVSGIHAARAGLSTVSHNIANSSAEGYTRQVAEQGASSALKQYKGVGMVGTGTTIYGIGQIRDFYLDKKYWAQEATLGEYTQKASQLKMLEAIFSSLSDKGFTTQINDLFNSFSDLSINSNDNDYKTAVVNNLTTVLNTIKEYGANLQKQQNSINEELSIIVQRINTISDQICSLNKQIYNYEIDGSSANDLRDQRALLIDELSTYVNTEVKLSTDDKGYEKMTILINGQELVNHYNNRTLELQPREELVNECDVPALYDIVWAGGITFDLTALSGELKGLIDVRDGDGSTYKGIPYYVNKLNEFVRTIAVAFNNGTDLAGQNIENVIGHTQAYNINGETGTLLFSYIKDDGTINTDIDIDYTKDINIFNISLSQEVSDNPLNLATFPTDDLTQESDNSVVLGFISLSSNRNLFREGEINQFINALSSSLGIDSSQAQSFQEYYTDVANSTENQRLQVSGVSLNEEIANLLKYQHLFQAASKLISTLNEIYYISINGLGI